MEQKALDMAKTKAARQGYDSSYIPELYQEALASLRLQERTIGGV